MHSSINHFDATLYINLEKRRDRKKHLEKELQKVSLHPDKIHRIEAYYDELNGSRGCVYSHIKALDYALQKRWRNVLILEDDCTFTKSQSTINSYIDHFLNHFNNEWDVFFLGTKLCLFESTSHSAYVQVHASLRAHAYAVNGPYLLKLRNHFISTYESMKSDLFFVSSLGKALDRQWATLQASDRWFTGIEMIAQQRRSFSDIEKAVKTQR